MLPPMTAMTCDLSRLAVDGGDLGDPHAGSTTLFTNEHSRT
ncbi:MAG TPA: hypothetical protein VJ723_08480 [Candidatus Angelobacter sp.]|nr:hypothetical protein [Candidatus Angelobacter sp.]